MCRCHRAGGEDGANGCGGGKKKEDREAGGGAGGGEKGKTARRKERQKERKKGKLKTALQKVAAMNNSQNTKRLIRVGRAVRDVAAADVVDTDRK